MFAKKPESATARPQTNMSGSTFSVLGTDVAIKGDIAARADLHIDGKVEGDIVTFVEPLKIQDNEINITYTGKISGNEIKFTRKVGARGWIGMTWPKGLQDIAIVLTALVGVLDEEGNRGTGGQALVHAREDLHRIGFVALGHEGAGARTTPVEVGLDVGFGQRQPRRAAVNHAADGRAMGLTKVGDRKKISKGIAAHDCIIPERRAGVRPSADIGSGLEEAAFQAEGVPGASSGQSRI